jgi:hypothetical protein
MRLVANMKEDRFNLVGNLVAVGLLIAAAILMNLG